MCAREWAGAARRTPVAGAGRVPSDTTESSWAATRSGKAAGRSRRVAPDGQRTARRGVSWKGTERSGARRSAPRPERFGCVVRSRSRPDRRVHGAECSRDRSGRACRAVGNGRRGHERRRQGKTTGGTWAADGAGWPAITTPDLTAVENDSMLVKGDRK